MSKINAIVIPGLGGKYHLYELACRSWPRHNLNPVVFPINWEDSESYEDKVKRLNTLIEKLSIEDKPIIIVGISAGASAALNAFARYETIQKVVLICGFMNISFMNQEMMGKRSRAFVDSVRELNAILPKLTDKQKNNILSLTSYNDLVVSDKAAHIDGVAHQKIRAHGHILGIAVALLFYAKTIRQASSS